jgi:hypothetical protein
MRKDRNNMNWYKMGHSNQNQKMVRQICGILMRNNNHHNNRPYNNSCLQPVGHHYWHNFVPIQHMVFDHQSCYQQEQLSLKFRFQAVDGIFHSWSNFDPN